jgi:hypothetical protein
MVENIIRRILPEHLEKKWLTWAEIDERGNILFEDVEIYPAGYWERYEGKPFFDDDLRSGLKKELFEDDPGFDVHACGPGMICEIDEDGHGYFEFDVWDVRKDRQVFRGTAWGECVVNEEEGYVDCIIRTVVLKPVEEE